MNLSSTLFSVATGSLAQYAPWNYRWLVDPQASAAFKSIGLRAVRINAMTALGDIFGSNLTNSPNWSHFDALVQGFNASLPNCKLIMVLCNHGMFNYADPGVRGRVASCYVQCAQYLKSKGVIVNFWEVLNEPNADTPSNVVADTEKAVRAALRAANDATPVGGPTSTWAQPEYMQASANAGSQFTDWHAYSKNPGENVTTDVLFDRARNQIGAGGSGPKPWFLTEYNIDTWHDPNVTPDPRQQQIEGAVFAALVNISCAYRDMAGTFIWLLENNDGSYGVFHTGTWNLNPAGCLIQAANRYLVPGGELRPFPGLSGRVAALMTDACALVCNYSTVGGPVNVPVPSGMSLRWTQSPAVPHGAEAAGAPAVVALQPMGIAIMSNTSGGVVPVPIPPHADDPDGTKVGPGVTLWANGHGWLIQPDGRIAVDGIPDATTAGVVSLQSVKPVVVQTNAAGGQWSKAQPSDPWTAYSAPVTPPVPVPPDSAVAQKAAAWDALVAALKPLFKAVQGGA